MLDSELNLQGDVAQAFRYYVAHYNLDRPFVIVGVEQGGTLATRLIAEEVELLGRVGGAEFALGAASWRAREWLGVDGLADGASADLVVYDADPRTDLSVVRHPRLVILRGRVVRS